MAKLTFSVIVAAASGKAGDVVFSQWKGRPYIRRRVTPANPNTAAQQAIRAALSLVTGSWKTLVSKVQDSWKLAAGSAGISGFNLFAQGNIAQERTSNWELYTAANAPREPVTAVTATTGTNPGEIDVDWEAGEAVATDLMHIATRLPEESAVTVEVDAVVVVSDLTYTITGLEDETLYCVYITNRDAEEEFAPSTFKTATSAV